jgi:hypothetical protein
MRLRALSLILGLVVCNWAQTRSEIGQNAVLQVSISNDQRDFHVGETIPLKLAFSSSVKDHYQVNRAQYDRSGRMELEHFHLTPASGTVDPLEGRLGGGGWPDEL